jgi:hypothetical protein
MGFAQLDNALMFLFLVDCHTGSVPVGQRAESPHTSDSAETASVTQPERFFRPPQG